MNEEVPGRGPETLMPTPSAAELGGSSRMSAVADQVETGDTRGALETGASLSDAARARFSEQTNAWGDFNANVLRGADNPRDPRLDNTELTAEEAERAGRETLAREAADQSPASQTEGSGVGNGTDRVESAAPFAGGPGDSRNEMAPPPGGPAAVEAPAVDRRAELEAKQANGGLNIAEAQELKKLDIEGERGTPPPRQADQIRYNAVHEKAVAGQPLTPEEAAFAASFESQGGTQQDVTLQPWQQRREELIAMEAKVNNAGGQLNTARRNELNDLDNREKVRQVREKEARGEVLTDDDREVKEDFESQVVAKEREEKIEANLAELRDRIASGDIKEGEAMEQLQEIRNLVGGPELKAIKPSMMKEAVRRAMSEAETTEQQKRTQEIIQEMMSIEAALLILPQQGKALMEKRDEVDQEIDDTERDMEHLDPNNPEDAQRRLQYYDLFMQRVNINAQILQAKYGATRMLAQLDVLQNQLDTATGRQGLLGHIGGAVIAYSRRWAHNAVFNLKASRERNPKM